MPDKREILNSIVAIARGLGRTPSLSEFTGLTEISKHRVLQFFSRWNDAVRAAGLEPCRLRARPLDSELLEDWGETVRRKKAIPSRLAYQLEGKHSPRTVEKRFGSWEAIPQVFRNFAKGKREWADVVRLLEGPQAQVRRGRPSKKPASAMLAEKQRHSGAEVNSEEDTNHGEREVFGEKTQHVRLKDRVTYGSPIHFRELRHEPVNEQGVVLLFGMLANDLGYLIEAVQKGFPDCEALRQVGPGRWQRVRIEFEFESRNFRDHGHSMSGCDVIVCWRHNWDDCPAHIEILELSSIIESLATSEN